MILVFAPHITPRIEYACQCIFKTILQTEFQLIDALPPQVEGRTVINYNDIKQEGCCWVKPSGLLIQTGIEKQMLEPGHWMELPTMFHSGEGDLPFDIFSAVFYMLSRYEEYLPSDKDIHGRFISSNSIAVQNNFAQIPIVEKWCLAFAKQLSIKNPFISKPSASYEFELTVDVDQAWYHKNLGMQRWVGGMLKNLLKGKLPVVGERMKVKLGKKEDPADNFQYLMGIAKEKNLNVKYFLLVGAYAKFDKNTPRRKKAFKELIQLLNRYGQVGIHPSYASNSDEKALSKEIGYLNAQLQEPIAASRQHFLKLSFPVTFQRLMRFGIKDDYSLGWPDLPGFRSGIARPYFFYDLQYEAITNFKLHPLVLMDRSLLSYLKLSTDEALGYAEKLIKETKSVGGTFSCLWHNDALSDQGEWKAWRAVFERILDLGSSH